MFILKRSEQRLRDVQLRTAFAIVASGDLAAELVGPQPSRLRCQALNTRGGCRCKAEPFWRSRCSSLFERRKYSTLYGELTARVISVVRRISGCPTHVSGCKFSLTSTSHPRAQASIACRKVSMASTVLPGADDAAAQTPG